MIILSPYSSKLRTGATNPKNYPHWQVVVDVLVSIGHDIVQIGVGGEILLNGAKPAFGLSLAELTRMVDDPSCKTWMSVDNFFPHLCSHTKKSGVVVWSRSDRSYLRPDQFGFWHDCAHDPESFVNPVVVVNEVLSKCN